MTQSEFHAYKANRAPMDSDKQRCLECGRTLAEHEDEVIRPLVERMKEDLVEIREGIPEAAGYAGDSPFFLIFERGPNDNVGIDIDQGGWIERNKALFRTPGVWILMAKSQPPRPVFAVPMAEGEQFFFVKHHVGDLMSGRQITAYGMGKKDLSGTDVRLWLLPNGMVCGGSVDDVDLLASRMLNPPPRP